MSRNAPFPDSADSVSVVMPVFNEAATVERVIGEVLAQPCVAQLVVIDDASTDGTPGILTRLRDADSRILLLTHPVNSGKGAAVRTGFREATGRIVLIQDADLEYRPAEYEKLIQPILSDVADVVFGSRFLGSEAHRVLYFWHYLANSGLTLLSNMTTNLNLTDMECCFKAFRREVVDQIVIEENRFGIEPELTAKVARLRVRIYEVSVGYHGRTYSEGKKIGLKDGFRALYAIAKYGFTHRPPAK